MSALTKDNLIRKWYQGYTSRQTRAESFAALKTAWIGSLCMAVDDVAMPVLAGTALAALCTTIPGADNNGGIILRSTEANVTVQFAGGLSKTLGVTSITYGSTIAILVQQATDGAGATTNTALEMANLLRGNAEVARLVTCKATGTGAGLTATAAATTIAQIRLLGIPERRIDNSASASPATLLPSIVFYMGTWGMDGSTPPLVDGDQAYILDDATVTKTADALNWHAPVMAIDGSIVYIDLLQAR